MAQATEVADRAGRRAGHPAPLAHLVRITPSLRRVTILRNGVREPRRGNCAPGAA